MEEKFVYLSLKLSKRKNSPGEKINRQKSIQKYTNRLWSKFFTFFFRPKTIYKSIEILSTRPDSVKYF